MKQDKQDAIFDTTRKYFNFDKFETDDYIEQDKIHSASGIGALDVAYRIWNGRGKIFKLPQNPTLDMLGDAYQAGFINGVDWYKKGKNGS
jgi:hypothetical protein